MSVLVLGAAGTVGSALAARSGCVGLVRSALDIRDDEAVEEVLDRISPHSVINCAAMAAVDRCDREPEGAWQVNAEAPGRVAAACSVRGIRFLHLSTDYALTGPERPGVRLDEDHPADPRSTYARSKRAGEIACLAHGATVVRVQWVYGVEGTSFFARALRTLAAGGRVRLVTDQVGVPTEVSWLAERLMDAARSGPTGLFHLAPDGEASAFTWITTAARALGISTQHAERIRRSGL
ncbi:MAG: SDR family oxidoreductase, partial [Myxococcota bacterium]|nr:SDR family oxidoreductase [Myxococcota bacterium]